MNKLDNLSFLIESHRAELQKPGVVDIRPGYVLKDGWPTTEPAIVVIVSQSAGSVPLPQQIDGTPVDVRTATDVEELSFQQPETVAKIATHRTEFEGGAFPKSALLGDDIGPTEEASPDIQIAATKPRLPYTPPDGASLQSVTGLMTITCHTSPDAGWPTLRGFLAGTTKSLTVGMYDFTSKHILDAVTNDLMGGKKLEITLDNPAKNPTADQTDTETIQSLDDSLSPDFQSAWALVQSNPAIPQWIYPNAYHIKVAVRDSKAMWLSSGNWNNSNQPDMDPIGAPASSDQALAKKSDRDWHVIIEHPGLAQTYEAFLKHDFDVAHQVEEGGASTLGAGTQPIVPPGLQTNVAGTFQFHAPLKLTNQQMTITPLLTPDPGVYVNAMLKLLDSAKKKLYIQLQYIHPSDGNPAFTALINKVVDKIAAGVDVRIILSQWQVSGGWLERLQAAGVSLNVVKIQNGVHNKGFVIDTKIVALGSQNWSSDGVSRNRDASVIIENVAAAKYYESIFLHDWTRLAKQKTQ